MSGTDIPPGQDTNHPGEIAQIRTFLIADIRGYTLFTQQRGDEAATKLAARFAGIAREVVEMRGGSVIELRGDEALAAFASARQAVAAAIDLQERFVDETIDDPDLPLPVGIGLDAGEAVPLEGGYRGGALNLAARLCGQAGPGEILASRSVTHLAQRVDGVRYVDRGRVHLKNLADPVEIVRIVPEVGDPAERLRSALPVARPTRRRARGRVVIAAGVAMAVAVAAAIVLLPRDGEPTIAAGAVGLLSSSGHLEGAVTVGERPNALAEAFGSLWVVDQPTRQLLEVDPSTLQVGYRIDVGARPSGLAIAGGLVWITNADDRTVSVVDPRAHKVVQTVVVGNGPTGIVADGDRVWVANGVDATVSEIDATDGRVRHTWPVGERPVALAVGDGAVWVANASDGTVSRIVPGSGVSGDPVDVGRDPSAIAFGSGSLWVANADDGTVMRIDPTSETVTGTATVGRDPVALATSGDDLWVASATDGTVAKIDPSTTRVTRAYEVGNVPRALAGRQSGVWVGVEASPLVHRGGTLRLVMASSMSLDPLTLDVDSAAVLASMYDGLVTYRRAGGAAGLTVVPDLAESLPEPTNAGRTYRFELRDGIRFSNGHVLTPADVVATFERVLVSPVGDRYPSDLLPELVGESSCTPEAPERCHLSEGVVADEKAGTVTFNLRRPVPDFLRILAISYFAIVPAGTPISLKGGSIPATGPYAVGDVGEHRLVLERNRLFLEWSSDAQPDGFPDRIEVTTGVEPAEQVQMVQGGQADIGLDGIPPDRAQDLERSASEQVVKAPLLVIGSLALNTATYPFNREDARRAVAFALNRDELVRAWSQTVEAVGGRIPVSQETQITCQILPPNMPGYAPYCPFTRAGGEIAGSWAGPDLARAHRLIERSGTLNADVTIAMSPCLDATAQQVMTTLRELEYHVALETDGPLRGPDSCWFGPLSPDADVSYTAWSTDYPSPGAFLVPLLSCVEPDGTPAVRGAEDFSFNTSNFCDPRIDQRMQQALRLELSDPHESARAFEDVEHDLVDLAPIIPYQTGMDSWFVSQQTGNVQVNPPLSAPVVSQVWIR